jgi:hypothetical protein
VCCLKWYKIFPSARQIGRKSLQFLEMESGQRLKSSVAVLAQLQSDVSVIDVVAGSSYEPGGFGSIDELYRAVVSEQ